MERRSFLRGLVGLIAAPAIVRVASIMPVKVPALVAASDLDALTFQGIPIDDPNSFSSIVTAALRANSSKLSGIVMRNNALYRRMMAWQDDKIVAGTWRT